MKKVTAHISRWEWKWGLIFISPWLIGFLGLYLAPMIASMGFSFMDFNLANPDQQKFVGLANWNRALFQDELVLSGVGKIVAFTSIALPISFAFALIMAIVLNSRYLLGTKLFRTLFYLPTMIPLVATVIIWSGVMNEQTGWINVGIENLTGIKATGAEGLRWLTDAHLIYFTYALIGLWGTGNTILIFLAGLQGIPTELYEASEVDGASWLTRLFRITFPMLTPVIFYNLVIGLIGMLQFFLVPFVLNQGNGAPDGSTNFIMVYFYRQSFGYFNMGYGAVIAWIIFLIALLVTLILFVTSKRWVYYASERA